jgi:hypothetical protein
MILTNPEFIKDIDIEKIEKKFSAKYLMEFPLKTKNGWRDEPSLIFYTEKPHPQGSNWFAISRKSDLYYISDAKDSIEESFIGIRANNGDIVYSRCRHDYRGSPDGSVWIDGGRDYFRTSMAGSTVRLKVEGGELVEIPKDVPQYDFQDDNDCPLV